eukprot:361791-Chlamydomonas_euryale.AAC.16
MVAKGVASGWRGAAIRGGGEAAATCSQVEAVVPLASHMCKLCMRPDRAPRQPRLRHAVMLRMRQGMCAPSAERERRAAAAGGGLLSVVGVPEEKRPMHGQDRPRDKGAPEPARTQSVANGVASAAALIRDCLARKTYSISNCRPGAWREGRRGRLCAAALGRQRLRGQGKKSAHPLRLLRVERRRGDGLRAHRQRGAAARKRRLGGSGALHHCGLHRGVRCLSWERARK